MKMCFFNFNKDIWSSIYQNKTEEELRLAFYNCYGVIHKGRPHKGFGEGGLSKADGGGGLKENAKVRKTLKNCEFEDNLLKKMFNKWR